MYFNFYDNIYYSFYIEIFQKVAISILFDRPEVPLITLFRK